MGLIARRPEATISDNALDIWVNGFSQFDVIAKANNSPVDVGTITGDTW
jgi:hypothetical protein